MSHKQWLTGVMTAGTIFILAGHTTAGAQGWISDSEHRQDTAGVFPGATALDPGVLRPHEASWRLVQAASGNEVGQFTRAVEFVQHSAGEPAILTRWHFTTPQRSALDTYYVHRETLMPFARYVTAPNGMWVQYQSEDRLVVSLTRRTGSAPVYVDTTNPGPRFNNAMLDFVLASLPLAPEYAVSWPSLGTSARSMKDALVTLRARVEARESMTLSHGRTVDTWRVSIQLSNGNRQRVWIAKTPPYLIRREALNRAGAVTVRWELLE